MTESNIQLSATQRALHLPELLSEIFYWIQQDRVGYWRPRPSENTSCTYTYCTDGVLLRCGLVNKLWFNEAMRYLRTAPINGYLFQNSLAKYFFVINPSRRQFYANFVKTAVLVTVVEGEAEECDNMLWGVVFPKLRTLELVLDDHRGFHIPRIENHRVRSLDVNPRFEVYPDTYGASRENVDEIFEQIAIIFPDLEEVNFVDRAQAMPGALERFAQSLSKLKNFDCSCVEESEVDLNFMD